MFKGDGQTCFSSGAGVSVKDDCGYPAIFQNAYVAAGYWRMETFRDALVGLEQKDKNSTALQDGARSFTYGRLLERVYSLISGLSRLGLHKGDHVIVQMPNSVEFVETSLALLYMGIVPVFALPGHRRLEISQFSRFVEAKAYFVFDKVNGFDHQGLAREILEDCPSLEHVIVVGQTEDFVAYETLLAVWDPGVVSACAKAHPFDVAVFQISGGTTGVPKLIPRRHMEYLYNIRTCADLCGVSSETVYLCALPVAHNFFFACPGIMGVLGQGGKVVLAPDPSPETCFELIERRRVTMAALVPPAALLWLSASQATDRDLSSLSLLQVGGAKLSEEPARKVAPLLNCKLQQVFGMAEGLICLTRLDDDEETIVTTQGRPISPGDEVRVVDETLQDVSPGDVGELLVRGPYTIRGYYKIPEHNERAFTPDGFYRSGDIVRILPDGSFSLCGREKDHINRGGEKIGPDEIENLLLGHGSVHDAAVVGLPDETLGERLCAFVIPAQGDVKPMVLRRHLQAKGLGAYKMPDQFVFVERFPETGVGKIDRKELRTKLKRAYMETHAARGEEVGVDGSSS